MHHLDIIRVSADLPINNDSMLSECQFDPTLLLDQFALSIQLFDYCRAVDLVFLTKWRVYEDIRHRSSKIEVTLFDSKDLYRVKWIEVPFFQVLREGES